MTLCNFCQQTKEPGGTDHCAVMSLDRDILSSGFLCFVSSNLNQMKNIEVYHLILFRVFL